MRWPPLRRLLKVWAIAACAVMALAVVPWWHGASLNAGPPVCPAEVVRCCDVGSGMASTASPAQLLHLGLQIWPEDVAQAGDRLREMQPAAVRYSGGPSWRRAP